jgi:hypothetical protein
LVSPPEPTVGNLQQIAFALPLDLSSLREPFIGGADILSNDAPAQIRSSFTSI